MFWFGRLWTLNELRGPAWPPRRAWSASQTAVHWDNHLSAPGQDAYRATWQAAELARALATAPPPNAVLRQAELWVWNGSTWQRAAAKTQEVRPPEHISDFTARFPMQQTFWKVAQAPALERWTTQNPGHAAPTAHAGQLWQAEAFA